MTVLNILKFPDSRLRTRAQAVVEIDDVLRAQVKDMYETMYSVQGIGLAATQVNIHQRFFTMDVSLSQDQPLCIINPEIIHKEGTQLETEGCLSVGGSAYDSVERAYKVIVKGLDLEGNPLTLEAEGLMASCIQHETDHLNGILFIDHLSRLKQDRIRKKIEKEKRRAE